MNQKAYWNSIASSKEFTTPLQMGIVEKYISRSASILDIGCGYGRTMNELYLKGYENVTGVDFSEKLIERGKILYPHLHLEVMQEGDLKYPDNTFDGVMLLAVLTCIVKNEEQIQLFNEIKRILKPNGIIYINDFLLNKDERNRKRYEEFSSKYNTYGVFELAEGAILRHHDKQWVIESLDIFDAMLFEEITYKTMNGNQSNGYYYLGNNRKKL